jgi:glycosyltransferase involved in cell wall biosynthesis
MLRLAVRRAARLVTVSESTRRDLEDLLGAPGERIRVIPNGVGARFQPARDPSALARSLGHLAVAPPYWLFVGNPLPHKNLEGLLDAVSGLDPGLGGLVVVGVRPAARARVDAAVARRQLGPRVRILAPVTEDVLPVLYQGALALVMPSLWEGFGLPVVEAMACGTPVIASDRGALPEVLGGVGLSVDPLNVDALREALYSVAVDRSVGAALSAAGLARARAFSWHAAAEATLAVYREVVGP